MIITFYTRDGQFTTDKFDSAAEARAYLAKTINPIMVQDIPSVRQKRAAIFLPNAEVSIHATHHTRLVHRPKHLHDDMRRKKHNDDKKILNIFGLEMPDNDLDIDDYENITDESIPPENFNKLLDLNTLTPEQEAVMDSDEQRNVERFIKRYDYFVDHVVFLYDNPKWEDCRKKYDDEFKKNY